MSGMTILIMMMVMHYSQSLNNCQKGYAVYFTGERVDYKKNVPFDSCKLLHKTSYSLLVCFSKFNGESYSKRDFGTAKRYIFCLMIIYDGGSLQHNFKRAFSTECM